MRDDKVCSVGEPHLRLHVHDAHLILGLDGADGLYACAVLVLLVFSVFYEPAGRGAEGQQNVARMRRETG